MFHDGRRGRDDVDGDVGRTTTRKRDALYSCWIVRIKVILHSLLL